MFGEVKLGETDWETSGIYRMYDLFPDGKGFKLYVPHQCNEML